MAADLWKTRTPQICLRWFDASDALCSPSMPLPGVWPWSCDRAGRSRQDGAHTHISNNGCTCALLTCPTCQACARLHTAMPSSHDAMQAGRMAYLGCGSADPATAQTPRTTSSDVPPTNLMWGRQQVQEREVMGQKGGTQALRRQVRIRGSMHQDHAGRALVDATDCCSSVCLGCFVGSSDMS